MHNYDRYFELQEDKNDIGKTDDRKNIVKEFTENTTRKCEVYEES